MGNSIPPWRPGRHKGKHRSSRKPETKLYSHLDLSQWQCQQLERSPVVHMPKTIQETVIKVDLWELLLSCVLFHHAGPLKKAKWSVDTFKTPSLHIFQFFIFLFIFSSVVSCTSMFMHHCICEELCDVSTLERCYINRVTSFFTKPWWYCIESLPCCCNSSCGHFHYTHFLFI